jgi:hypothetical protein
MRGHNGDDHAPDIQAGDAYRTEQIKKKSTHESADNSQRDVGQKPWSRLLTILLPMNLAIKPSRTVASRRSASLLR